MINSHVAIFAYLYWVGNLDPAGEGEGVGLTRRGWVTLALRVIEEELRPASGRAGAAIGASRASRTPECGTLCCRRRGMAALLHVGRSSFSSSFLTLVKAIHAAGDKWADRDRSALPPTTDHGGSALPF